MFRPKIGDKIAIGGANYRFTEHPSARGMLYGQTGRRATVYQLLDSQGNIYAFKVFSLGFRKPQNAQNAKTLNGLSKLPGLDAAHRYVLTKQTDPDLLTEYPDLEFAALMPWIEGTTWQEFMLEKEGFSAAGSLQVAKELAAILAQMERKEIAHCDLSGPNIMINLEGGVDVKLVDMEDLYSAQLIEPDRKPAGSSGYAHQTAQSGLWKASADRFAGAVLLAEILAWCDARVNEAAYGEQYFNSSEMQIDSKRFSLMATVLAEQWGDEIAELFKIAWQSKTLERCPSFEEWFTALQSLGKQQIQAYVDNIKELQQQGRLEEADEMAAEAYELNPRSIGRVWFSVLMQAAGEAEDSGRYKRALRALERARELNLTDPQADEVDQILRRVRKKEARKKQADKPLEQSQNQQKTEGASAFNIVVLVLIGVAIMCAFAMMLTSTVATPSQSRNPSSQQAVVPTTTPRVIPTTPNQRPTTTPRIMATRTVSTLSSSSNSCSGAPPQRIDVGSTVVVCTSNDSVFLRSGPSKNYDVIRRAPPGTLISVIGGPACADNWSWWEVRLPSGYTGWMAEGGDFVDPYFLCPQE